MPSKCHIKAFDLLRVVIIVACAIARLLAESQTTRCDVFTIVVVKGCSTDVFVLDVVRSSLFATYACKPGVLTNWPSTCQAPPL